MLKMVWNLITKERENIFLIRQADVDNRVFLAIRSNWNQWLEKSVILEE